MKKPRQKDEFFAKMDASGVALTFGDVSLVPGFAMFDPEDVDLKTRFSRRVSMKIPLLSAAMDTVTESAMAIAMAIQGGLGIIHRNLTPEAQAAEVFRVKRHLGGRIESPVTVQRTDTIAKILERIQENGWSFRSFPVLDEEARVVGILAGDDFEFCTNPSMQAKELMTPWEKLVTGNSRTTVGEAHQILSDARKKILPLVDDDYRLAGMFLWSDVKRIVGGDSAPFNTDDQNRLMVGAAVGLGEDALTRAQLLLEAGVDVLVIEMAHGGSEAVVTTLRKLKHAFPTLDVVAGNVSEGMSALQLVNAGADGIRVGQGGGSICTTRNVTGTGCPQLTAVHLCEQALRDMDIPICSDGGVVLPGDVAKALAAGADTVMAGRVVAGTDETPGQVIYQDGRQPIKVYRGMGSEAAMRESSAARERYRHTSGPLIPEGVESVVPYQGSVQYVIETLTGSLGKGMFNVGARTIDELHEKARFCLLSPAGLRESHPHDVRVTDQRTYSRRERE